MLSGMDNLTETFSMPGERNFWVWFVFGGVFGCWGFFRLSARWLGYLAPHVHFWFYTRTHARKPDNDEYWPAKVANFTDMSFR